MKSSHPEYNLNLVHDLGMGRLIEGFSKSL